MPCTSNLLANISPTYLNNIGTNSTICIVGNLEALASADLAGSGDNIWILTSSFIIFTMQSGFGLLETGKTQSQFVCYSLQ